MEKRFECQFEITEEMYLEMSNNPIAPDAKKRLRIFYIRNIVSICLGAALVLFSLIANLSTWLVVFCFAVTMLPVYLLASRNDKNKKAYSNYLKMNHMDKWERTVSFTDEQVSSRDGDTEVSLAYLRFDALTQNDDWFYLHGGTDLCLRVPKDSFTLGTKEDFAPFFEGKVKA